MTNVLKIVGAVIAGVVIGYFAHAVITGQSFGGVYEQTARSFSQGFNAGTSNQMSVSSAGAVTTSASVSVATTSTSRMLNVGAGGSATSTVNLGKPCFQVTTDTGATIYAWFHVGDGSIGAIATSTTSCF